ncbi:MAG: hypothetical protein ABIO44_06380 [Saprospiraceae bacterium]
MPKTSSFTVNPLYARDFLLQAIMPANPSTSSNFYPHHGSDHDCGKNSPGAPVFIGLLTFTTKLYCIKRVENDGLHPSLKILYSSGVFFNK